jgi:hypothetical protein
MIVILVAFLTFNFVFWGGWFALFGAPTGGIRYAALAICIILCRLCWHYLHRRLPRTQRSDTRP